MLLTLLDIRWRCFKCGTINLSSGAGGRPVRCESHEGGGGDDCSVEEYGQTIDSMQPKNGVSSHHVQAMSVIASIDIILPGDQQEQNNRNGVIGCDSQGGVIVTSL